MNIKIAVLVTALFSTQGCESTFRPKLNDAEKNTKKAILKNSNDPHFNKYIDLLFIKSCEDLFKYAKQEKMKIISVDAKSVLVETVEGKQMEVNLNAQDCSLSDGT